MMILFLTLITTSLSPLNLTLNMTLVKLPGCLRSALKEKIQGSTINNNYHIKHRNLRPRHPLNLSY